MRRRANLLRYSAWQLLDYLLPAGVTTGGLVALLTWGVVHQVRFMEKLATQRPGLMRMPADVWGQSLPPLLYILIFLGTLLASHGIVSEGRRLGYYRFLFAKPLNPVRFYGQTFAVNGLGFVGLSVVLIALFSYAIHPIWSWQFVTALAVAYLAFAGIGFLLSVLTRGDGAVLIVGLLVTYMLGMSWETSTGWRQWVLEALPPVSRTSDLVKLAFGTLTTFPWHSVLWLAGYGAGCFVLGLIVLRRRSFGEA